MIGQLRYAALFSTFSVLLFFLFVHPISAQRTADELSAADTILVGVAGSKPFVFGADSDTAGIAVDIWNELAERKGFTYRLRYFGSVDEALTQMDEQPMDVVVGPISITSDRIERMSFSQPFYNSSLGILSRADELTLWDKIKPFFSLQLLWAVLVFIFILAVVGTLLWLTERKAAPDEFPDDPVNGIGNGMWLAIVTMSTVGYGDKAPVTLAGRIVTGAWIVVSIIFATSMVAGIASTLTLSSMGSSTITNIEGVDGRKAATVAGSPSEAFLRENGAKVVGVGTLDEAMAQLENGEVDAVVYDRPQLLYHKNISDDDNLYISKAEYYKQGYGFAFPIGSDMVYDVNRTLLELAEDQEIVRIVENYLDKDE